MLYFNNWLINASILILVTSVSFDQSVYSIIEHRGPVQVKIILSILSEIDITVKVFSNHGSATGKF